MPCGPGLRSVAWPETPSVRAAALAPWFDERRIACCLTAAWIWGAIRSPGSLLEFALDSGRPLIGEQGGVRLNQFRLEAGDVAELGGFAVTSPARTAYDLLRREAWCEPQRLAVRVLLAFDPEVLGALRERLELRSRPHDKRVLGRLASTSASAGPARIT